MKDEKIGEFSEDKMSSLEMELEQGEESLGDDILNLPTADIQARTRLLDNEVNNKHIECYYFSNNNNM